MLQNIRALKRQRNTEPPPILESVKKDVKIWIQIFRKIKYYLRANVASFMLCKYIKHKNFKSCNILTNRKISLYIHFIIEDFMIVFFKTLRHQFIVIKKSTVFVALNSRTSFNHLHTYIITYVVRGPLLVP